MEDNALVARVERTYTSISAPADLVHREHRIHYSYLDNDDATFQPFALIIGNDDKVFPVLIPSQFSFNTRQQALDHALVQAIAAVDKRIDG